MSIKIKIIALLLCLCSLSLAFAACTIGGAEEVSTTDSASNGTDGESESESEPASVSETDTDADETTSAAVAVNEEEVAAMNDMLSDAYMGYVLPIGGWATPYAGLREAHSGEVGSYDRPFQLLADSGLNFIITVEEWSSIGWSLDSLSSANRAGMKLWYNCVGQETDYMLERINAMLASDDAAALGAIYYKDEPTLGDIDGVAAAHEAIKTSLGDDSKIPVFSNLLPTYATTGMVGSDYRAYVSTYLEKAKPDLLMFDHYPFGGTSSDTLPAMIANIAIMREEADRAGGVDLYSFIQSSQHMGLREPSLEELRVNAHINLAMGVKGFAYFLACEHYENWGFSHMISYKGETTKLYDKVKTLNGELAAMKGVFLGFENKGIMLSYSDADTALQKVGSTMVLESFGSLKEFDVQGKKRAKAMLGCFEDENGREGYYLVNASYSGTGKLTLTFDEAQSYLVWTKNGVTLVENTDKLTVDLDRGEGAFVVKFNVNSYTNKEN